MRALDAQRGGVSLRLYVARDTVPSAQARRQLAALRERLGGEHWEVEVVDVFEQPGLAETDRILATPVLIRLLPEPRLSVIGDFSDSLAVAIALDLGDPGPGLFRFDPDGAGALWSPAPLHFANGLALAPDGGALYVAETFGRAVQRIPILRGGAAGRPEVIARLPGRLPDGLAFASDGGLYVGCYEPSQVLRIEPDGTVGVVAADPDAHLLSHPTNLAFRGSELFVANLGRWHVTVIDAGLEGAPLPPRRA